MNSTIPEVHLFLALDPKISPGPVLQCLDYLRAKEWQQETVLVCNEAWRPYVHADQTVLFLNQNDFYINGAKEKGEVNMPYLEQFLEQLDNFEIVAVTQLGSLSWGRWIRAYLEENKSHQLIEINEENSLDSIDFVNCISNELQLDLSSPIVEKSRTADVFIDPYHGNSLSPQFVNLIQGAAPTLWPEWLCVIAKKEDFDFLRPFCGEDAIIDKEDIGVTLFNQHVLCFSDESQLALTSRSYNVALYGSATLQSLFFQGDIAIATSEAIHLSEVINILSYWKAGRLKELAFQWYNMGIDIEVVEFFHDRLVRRNLQTYSSDLFNCQQLVSHFNTGTTAKTSYEIHRLIDHLSKQVINDPFSLSFSLKMLVMITERMLASAACGERLFHRLGSDFHRVIIGESLIEGILVRQEKSSITVDVRASLSSFLKYLVQVDYLNDQKELNLRAKES